MPNTTDQTYRLVHVDHWYDPDGQRLHRESSCTVVVVPAKLENGRMCLLLADEWIDASLINDEAALRQLGYKPYAEAWDLEWIADQSIDDNSDKIRAFKGVGTLVEIEKAKLSPVDGGWHIEGGIGISSEDLYGFHRHPEWVDRYIYLRDHGRRTAEENQRGLSRFEVVKTL